MTHICGMNINSCRPNNLGSLGCCVDRSAISGLCVCHFSTDLICHWQIKNWHTKLRAVCWMMRWIGVEEQTNEWIAAKWNIISHNKCENEVENRPNLVRAIENCLYFNLVIKMFCQNRNQKNASNFILFVLCWITNYPLNENYWSRTISTQFSISNVLTQKWLHRIQHKIEILMLKSSHLLQLDDVRYSTLNFFPLFWTFTLFQGLRYHRVDSPPFSSV